MHLTTWDLIPSRSPEIFSCSQCKSGHMLSRPAILLTLVPSLVLSLLVVLVARSQSEPWWLMPALLAAYLVGLPIGARLARRYGRLVRPHKPWPRFDKNE